MSKPRMLPTVALSILSAATTWGQTLHQPSEAVHQDAATYAELTGVGLDEAVRRLQLQRAIGDLDATLSQKERNTFAGLWIEHKPHYRIVVRFTERAAEDRLRTQIAGTSLEGLAITQPAAVSLVQLEERQATARRLAEQIHFAVDTDINVRENRVEIYSDRPQGLRAAFVAARATLPERVEIVAVAGLSQPGVLRGGEHGSTCTGGFTVARNGEFGISTAAHCDNTQFFQGVSLPFRSEDREGNQDVQWHSACGRLNVSNEFNSGIGFRACTGTQPRDQQAIGSFVCKYGKTAGRQCGFIQSKNISVWWITNSAATFVRGDGAVSLPGDSGGPWFVEGIAYGIHSGSFDADNDGIYMPINYISSLGVSVLTQSPGSGSCAVCGNMVCESGENSGNCCIDCGTFCGDGICEASCGESDRSCPSDCGGGSILCGNGTCEVLQGECAATCPQDCPFELCQ